MVKFRKIILISLFCLTTASLCSQVSLDSVVVKAKRERISSAIYTPKKTRFMVSVTGENDPVKFIATQPGVSTGVEGTSSIFVRGGNNGNNRIELDGVPFYDSGHLLGLISSFPSEIIDNISFRKEGLSSANGDFSASLTEIKSKSLSEGSSVSLSPFFASIYNSGYLYKKKKISYLTSARYTLLDPLWKVTRKITSSENFDFKPVSGDLFLRLNFPISPESNIYAGMYYSYDDISFSESSLKMSLNWGNKSAYASWEYMPVHWFKIETKGYLLRYNSKQKQYSIQSGLNALLSIDEAIDEYAVKSFARIKVKKYSLLTGIEFKQRKFNCATNIKHSITSENINSFFADFEYNTGIISSTAGIRQTGRSMNFTDLHFDLMAHLGSYSGMEISYDKMHQFYHIAEGGLTGWRDFILPAYDSLPPERCRQIYIGGYYSREYAKFTIGAFYKKMDNLTSLKKASDLFLKNFKDWSQILEVGRGESRGIECSTEIKTVKFSAILNYTLSRTDRCYKEINEGNKFPFQYDRRHILNFAASLNVKENREMSQLAKINLTYTSGGYSTIPISRFEAADLPYLEHFTNNGLLTDLTLLHLHSLLIVPGLNGYKMPEYFRIDAGYVFTWRRNRSETELTLGITNVLNRHNASLIFYRNGLWRQLSIIPILPSVCLKISLL